MISSVAFVVRLDARLSEVADVTRSNQEIIAHHIEQPWHTAAAERYKSQDERMNMLESRIHELEQKR